MEKGKDSSKYDGFSYYKPKLYSDPNSSYNSFYTNYFVNFAKKYEKVDNSEFCFLDLQGAYGKWGNLISKQLGAKKCIVTDYSENMVEYGKTLYPENEAEFYALDFEKSLTDERITKYKYCGILIKEAIHFTDEGFAARLLEFFKKHCTENAFILCPNHCKAKYWKDISEYLPPTFMKEIDKTRYDSMDLADDFRELTKNEKGFKIESKVEPVLHDWTKEDFIYFLEKRMWSMLRVVPEDELNIYIEKAKKVEAENIGFNHYCVFAEISKTSE